jgi:hypothetical protein
MRIDKKEHIVNRKRPHLFPLLGAVGCILVLLLASGWGRATASQISSIVVNNDAAHPVPVDTQASLIDVGDNFTVAQGSDFDSPFVDTSGCSEIQVLLDAHPGNGGTDVATLRISTDGTHFTSWPATYSDASPGQTLETFFFYHLTHFTVTDEAPTRPVVAPEASVHVNDASPASDRIDRALIYCLP